ncbi:MAG: hypothetical protein H7281_12960 [Bacteriovorax sp.]|nr:hypothetical protein [Bacteriovorax sp.]
MKYLLLTLMILLLQACLPFQEAEVSPEEAEMKIYNEWIFAFKVQDLKVNDQIITRPPGIEQLIFRLVIPTPGGVNFKTQCVYYQVPYKKIMGLLKIVEQKNVSSCSEVSSGDSWLELIHLSDLKVKLVNFKLILDFKYKNQKKVWTFLLPNIENGVIHEKYQAVKERKIFPGLTLLRINDESFANGRNNYLGKLSDRMSRGTAIRCQQVDKNCQNVGENRCDSCAYGWYQVVDYTCPQGGSKFCGQNHCGEKNEPACLRGTKVVEGSDSGICQSDLSAVLNADHVLVCQ